MSSLQKFHRRTNGGVPAVKLIGSEAPVAGAGFYLGLAGDGTSYMYVAPKSTESTTLAWGGPGVLSGATSLTDGVTNTTTLANAGSLITTGHPAAYYCKNLSTGGYNTWYLPAKNELNTLYSNKSATPFATANAFTYSGAYYWSSTEYSSTLAWKQNLTNGYQNQNGGKQWTGGYTTRAVRRSLI